MARKLSRDETEHICGDVLPETGSTGQLGTSGRKWGQANIVTANIDTGNITTVSAPTISGNVFNVNQYIVMNAQTSITAHYTVGNYTAILCNATSGAITLTLPASSSQRIVIVKKKALDSSANAITLTPASGTIDNAASNAGIDAAGDMMIILSDGTNWHIIAQKLA